MVLRCRAGAPFIYLNCTQRIMVIDIFIIQGSLFHGKHQHLRVSRGDIEKPPPCCPGGNIEVSGCLIHITVSADGFFDKNTSAYVTCLLLITKYSEQLERKENGKSWQSVFWDVSFHSQEDDKPTLLPGQLEIHHHAHSHQMLHYLSSH